MTWIVQGFYAQSGPGKGWTDLSATEDTEEAKHILKRLGMDDPNTAFRMVRGPATIPVRYIDDAGRTIVQVEFEPGGRRYAYAWGGADTIRIGDTVKVPANWVSTDGGTAKVVDVGSEFAGELAVIEEKVAFGESEAAKIVSQWPLTAKDVLNYPGKSRYEDEDNISYE